MVMRQENCITMLTLLKSHPALLICLGSRAFDRAMPSNHGEHHVPNNQTMRQYL